MALNGGRPETMNLKDMLVAFVAFREEVVTRRTKFLLNKARDRAHVLVGLAIAVANIDEVIRIIRHAKDPNAAREEMMGRRWPAKDVAPLIALIDDPRHRLQEDGTYVLSDAQARAILELRLARLTALGREEIAEELNKIAAEITDYLDILRSRARVQTIIKDELKAIRDEFATPRKTVIEDGGADLEDEDLIQREDMVVTVTHAGWIKRVPLDSYRAQRRGGKGRSGMATKEEDFVTRLFVANTHTPILFFSSRGIVYKEKVWRLPLAAPQARGKALVNLLPLTEGERITSILPLPEDEAMWGELDVMFATRAGTVRRNKLSDFVQVNRNGKIAMKFDSEDEAIVDVQLCTEADDVLLTTAGGQCIRFPVDDVRVFKGRDSTGVRGIALAKDDRVISMAILRHFDATADERNAYLKMSRAVRGEGEADATAEADDEEATNGGELSTGALRRDGRRRAVHPDRVGERLRQAHLVVRVPDHRPRRQGHRRHGGQRAQRPAGRLLPGRGRRRDHAGHRWRPGDPHAGPRHPHHRPRHAGRDAVRRRRRREGGLGRAAQRGRGRGATRARPPADVGRGGAVGPGYAAMSHFRRCINDSYRIGRKRASFLRPSGAMIARSLDTDEASAAINRISADPRHTVVESICIAAVRHPVLDHVIVVVAVMALSLFVVIGALDASGITVFPLGRSVPRRRPAGRHRADDRLSAAGRHPPPARDCTPSWRGRRASMR